MKYRGQIFFSVVLVALLAAAYYPQPNNAEKETVLMKAVLSGFGQLHYQPKKIDDNFSGQIFDFYLDQADGGRRFLTQEDIAKLEGYRDQIDDQAQNGTFEFFNASVQMLEAALDKTQAYYQEMLETPFDYSAEEMIELDSDKKPFAQNDEELKAYWRKYLKYETVQRIVNKTKEEEKKGEEETPKSFEEIEAASREAVLDFLDDWYGRMRKLKREDRMSVYLNTFTHIFDPHSEYYQPIDNRAPNASTDLHNTLNLSFAMFHLKKPSLLQFRKSYRNLRRIYGVTLTLTPKLQYPF